jgi:hypothetical protein
MGTRHLAPTVHASLFAFALSSHVPQLNVISATRHAAFRAHTYPCTPAWVTQYILVRQTRQMYTRPST